MKKWFCIGVNRRLSAANILELLVLDVSQRPCGVVGHEPEGR
jgi:hypothetical protein